MFIANIYIFKIEQKLSKIIRFYKYILSIRSINAEKANVKREYFISQKKNFSR